MRINWLETARVSLNEAMIYIAQDDIGAAKEIYAYIRSRVEQLKELPSQGRQGRIFGTRELVLGKYPFIIPYRIKDNEIQILRIFHTSQEPPENW